MIGEWNTSSNHLEIECILLDNERKKAYDNQRMKRRFSIIVYLIYFMFLSLFRNIYLEWKFKMRDRTHITL